MMSALTPGHWPLPPARPHFPLPLSPPPKTRGTSFVSPELARFPSSEPTHFLSVKQEILRSEGWGEGRWEGEGETGQKALEAFPSHRNNKQSRRFLLYLKAGLPSLLDSGHWGLLLFLMESKQNILMEIHYCPIYKAGDSSYLEGKHPRSFCKRLQSYLPPQM